MTAKLSKIFLLTFLLGANIFLLKLQTAGQSNLAAVSFLDVGQGDAILIESPSGNKLLIDTGKEGAIGRPLLREMSFFDKDIEILILTHSDADHIGGAFEVLNNFKVKTLVINGDYDSGEMEKRIIETAKVRGVNIIEAMRGQVIDLGGGAEATIIFPDRNTDAMETNTASVGLKFTYGESDFILTGDMPSVVEDYLVSLDKGVLDSEVLKLGHHGSKTSTSKNFLRAVSPEYAVVSAGKNNSYGHPHKEVTDRLSGIGVLETYKNGTVRFQTDGVSLWTK